MRGKAVLLGIVAFGLGAFVFGNFSGLAGELTNTSMITGSTVQQVDLNGESMVGETVTVSGTVFPRTNEPYNGMMEDSSGYEVKLDCADYLEFTYSQKYTVTGEVSNISVTEYTGKADPLTRQKTVQAVDCTQPPG